MAGAKKPGVLSDIADFVAHSIFRRSGTPKAPPPPSSSAPPPPSASAPPGPTAAPSGMPGVCLPPDKVKDLLDKIDKMIASARANGANVAADNLENWRKKGGDRKLAAAVFQNEAFLLKHLATKHRQKFIDGAKRRIKDGTVAPGDTFSMHWEDSVNAPPDNQLFYALGGFTVRSEVSCKVNADAKANLALHFDDWKFTVYDEYNWDRGGTMIPGIGYIADADMNCLEQMGYGKSFKINTDPIPVTDTDVVKDAPLE